MPAPKEFAEQIAPEVIASCVNTGVFPSVVIAQAIQESGSGSSKQASLFNNLFGHMASKSWTDKGGKAGQTVRGGKFWRIYNSLTDSISAHVKIFKNTAYKLTGVLKAKTPFEQIVAIEKGGYNTGPDREVYARKLARIINGLGLQRYDQQMLALERQKNTNSLAYSEQDGITRTLRNLFA